MLTLLAASVAAAAWFANPNAAQAGAETLRLHLPFPLTGPRDIHGMERATRTYRAISPHAPQPISDVIARIVVSAARGMHDTEVVTLRQPSTHNQLDLASFDAAPAARHGLLLLSHEAIVPLRSAAARPALAATAGPASQPGSIAPIVIMPLALLASARVPAFDLLAMPQRQDAGARATTIGSAGGRSASRVAAALLAHAIGMDHLHLGYNGGHAALNALARSEIDLLFAGLPLVLPYIDAGRVRALGLASEERFPLLPALPTLAEQGAPELTCEGWFGLYAAARMSPSLRSELLRRLAASVASRPVRSALLQQGLQPADVDPQRFTARVVAERDRAVRLLADAD